MNKNSIHFIDNRIPFFEGSKKNVYDGNDYSTSLLYFKDTILSNDGKSININEKGFINNALSSYIFDKLNTFGFQTHYILKQNGREQLVQNLEIIPAHIHVYNAAPMHIAKPMGLSDSVMLPVPVVDWFARGDSRKKSLMSSQHFESLGIVSSDEVKDINSISLKVNQFLIGFFAALGLQLNDVQLRFGRRYNEIIDDTEIILGDEISLDTCYLTDMASNQKYGFSSLHEDSEISSDSYKSFLRRCPFDLMSFHSNHSFNDADIVNFKTKVKEAVQNGH
ncbi:MAG: hypothetical protein CMM87_04760 [Rickettsiales bacterium]|nr:hypothetical protein [Rickettsiales bacterium]|tara:strand:- start:12427 stop:13263 length:837 start_codon:yes stop_codon:yes gene_type:complete